MRYRKLAFPRPVPLGTLQHPAGEDELELDSGETKVRLKGECL